MKKLTTFTFLLTLIACSNEMKTSNRPINDTVHVVIYDGHENIDWKTAKLFSKDKTHNEIIFNYKDTSRNKIISNYLDTSTSEKSKTPLGEKLTIFKNHDSINFFGQICYLRDYKRYSIQNKSFIVFRYFLNDLATIDEEAEIYINDSLGIIRICTISWVKTVTYIKDSITYKLNKELRNDTSTFVRNNSNRDRYHKELGEFLKSRKKNNKR